MSKKLTGGHSAIPHVSVTIAERIVRSHGGALAVIGNEREVAKLAIRVYNTLSRESIEYCRGQYLMDAAEVLAMATLGQRIHEGTKILEVRAIRHEAAINAILNAEAV